MKALLRADRATAEARTRRRLTRERDDLLAMKARVEALADDFMAATEAADGDTQTAQFMRDLRAAIRGES